MPDGKEVSVNEIYKEQYAHFRAMNDILYKIPPLFSVAIGGLWYFAASQLKTEEGEAGEVEGHAATSGL